AAGLGEGLDERHVVARVVELAVRIGYAADQAVRIYGRHAAQHFLTRHKMARCEARATRNPIIELQTCFVVSDVKPVVARSDEFSGAGEKRSVPQHMQSLVERAVHYAIFGRVEMAEGFFEVTHAAVSHFRRSAGSGGSKIARFELYCLESAQLS